MQFEETYPYHEEEDYFGGSSEDEHCNCRLLKIIEEKERLEEEIRLLTYRYSSLEGNIELLSGTLRQSIQINTRNNEIISDLVVKVKSLQTSVVILSAVSICWLTFSFF